jgi:membrane-bound ClpP family serine protease
MASHYEQCTSFGNTYLLRNAGIGVSMLLLGLIGVLNLEGSTALFLWLLSAMLVAATALIGRALFYALVIPTTMPGAFFWRNKGFEEHARETGLAEMPQVGVLPECH